MKHRLGHSNFWPKFSFRNKLILIFSILCAVSSVVIGSLCYLVSYHEMEKNMVQYTNVLVNQVAYTLDSYLEEVVSSLKSVAVDKDVIESFKKSGTGEDEEYYRRNRNIALLQDIVIHKPDIKSIILYNDQNLCYSSMSNVSVNPNSFYLQEIRQQHQNDPNMDIHFHRTHIPDYYPMSRPVVSLSIPVRDISFMKKENLAVALLDINFKKIENVFSSLHLQNSEKMFMVDNENNIVYPASVTETPFSQVFSQVQGESGYFYEQLDGREYMVTYATSKVSGWKIVYFFLMNDIRASLSGTRNITILLVLTILLLSVAVSVMLSVKNTKPIQLLTNTMKQAELGKLNVRITERAELKDIQTLFDGFNSMISQIEVLLDEVRIQVEQKHAAEQKSLLSEIKQKEAELDALQAKMNPHFLYNTLQTIKSLATLGENESVSSVTVLLGNMLSYLIYEPDSLVPAQKELDYLQSYLTIQQIRFENSFEVETNIDEPVKSFKIMKLLLQPLVENVFKHAVGDWQRPLKIVLEGKEEQEWVRFTVIDNGAGMEKERLDEVTNGLEKAGFTSSSGSIGLRNVYDRLKLMYGDDFRFTLESELGKGTCVTIFIRKERRNGDDSSFSG